MSTKDITNEDVMVDEGLPLAQTDAAGFTPEAAQALDAIEVAAGELMSIPAVQAKVTFGVQSIAGYGTAAIAGIGAALGLADVLNMPSWLAGTLSVISAILVALVGKNRTDQQKVLDAREVAPGHYAVPPA